VGIPAGAFNLVHGDGVVAGEALVGDERLSIVSFTGSGRAGRRVAELAGSRLTKVALELGGKGASVVLPGGDVEAAARHAVASCFGNAGQTCAAMTRVIVVRDELPALEAAVAAASAQFIAGDPLAEETGLGPVI